MLCKVSSDYIFQEPNIDAGNVFTTNTNITAHNYWQIGSVTTPGGGKKYKYKLYAEFYGNGYSSASNTQSIYATIDGGTRTLLERLPVNGDGNYKRTYTIEAKTSIILESYNNMQNSASAIRIDAQTNKYSVWIPPKDGINGKPRELKEIWNKARTTIFWIHIDNTRVTQE